jgi:predicted oxidoreductase (fatty acid repression mutant protein)
MPTSAYTLSANDGRSSPFALAASPHHVCILLLQSYVWTLLASKQIGASLQHYSNLIEPEILETFDLPTTWKVCQITVLTSFLPPSELWTDLILLPPVQQLKAQMPFGGIEKEASSKSVKPVKGERVLVFGQSDAGSA